MKIDIYNSIKIIKLKILLLCEEFTNDFCPEVFLYDNRLSSIQKTKGCHIVLFHTMKILHSKLKSNREKKIYLYKNHLKWNILPTMKPMIFEVIVTRLPWRKYKKKRKRIWADEKLIITLFSWKEGE